MGAPKFWCPGTRSLVPFQADQQFFVLISRMGFRTLNFSCLPIVFICFTQNLVILEHCQHEMSMHWWENTLNKVGGIKVLVPGHQKSGALSSRPTVFCFNFKNGLQSFEFLLFAKCIYVFYTKPGFIRTRSAWMSVQWRENPKKIGGGTRVLVPGHQNSGACYLPDWLCVILHSVCRFTFSV